VLQAFWVFATANERQKSAAYNVRVSTAVVFKGHTAESCRKGSSILKILKYPVHCIRADCLDPRGRHAHCMQHRLRKIASGDDDLDAGQGDNLRASERDEARQYLGRGDM
jgi:hypothetical protein